MTTHSISVYTLIISISNETVKRQIIFIGGDNRQFLASNIFYGRNPKCRKKELVIRRSKVKTKNGVRPIKNVRTSKSLKVKHHTMQHNRTRL